MKETPVSQLEEPREMVDDSPPWTHATLDLDERVQRLEDVVSSLCDTQALEARVRDQVVERLRESHGGDTVHDFALGETANAIPAPAPLAAAYPATGLLPLPYDIWRDLTTCWRMIRDPHYRMSWLGTLAPLFALLYVTIWPIFSEWVMPLPSVPLLGFLDDLVVLYLGLKVLGREMRRYQDVLRSRR